MKRAYITVDDIATDVKNKFGDDIASLKVYNHNIIAIHGDKDPQRGIVDKINSYLQIIDNNNNNNLSQYNEEEKTLINRSKEIKTLLEELKEVIDNCTKGLSSDDVKKYITSFKDEIIQRGKEITMLIDEIKYNLANYLALKSDMPNDIVNDAFCTKEDELTKLSLENENLKIQIENLEFENDIIKKFLDKNK